MTPTPRYPDYQVAPGYNNEAELVAWESLVGDGETSYMLAPSTRGGFNPGQTIIRGDGRMYLAGHRSITLAFTWVSYGQDLTLQEDYCGGEGSYDGLVTARLRLHQRGDYANYNAVLSLPKPNERDEAIGRINNYRIALTRLSLLP